MPKVMRSVKTAPWIQGRSKVRPTVSVQEDESASGDSKTFRRSLGLDTFPNVLLFRTCMPFAGKHNMETAVMDMNFTDCNEIEIVSRPRFQTCDGFVGQSQTQWQRGMQDPTREAKKVNCESGVMSQNYFTV